MAMSERRTAVRMLHGPCSDNDATGTSTPGCASSGPRPALQQNPPTPGRQSFRRRSLCFPSPAPDEAGCNDGPLWKSAGIPTCSSPAATSSGEAPPKLSVNTTPPGCLSDQDSPHHLSVPLTLLSLHNGGARHSPRNLSRDVSPLALLITREGSISSGLADADAGDDGTAGGNSTHAGAAANTSLSGSKSVAWEHCRTTGSPPMPPSAQLPPVASLAAAGIPSAGALPSPVSPVGGRPAVSVGGRVPTPALAPPGIRVTAASNNASGGGGGGSSRGAAGTIPLAAAPLGGGPACGAGGGDSLLSPVCAAGTFLPSNSNAAVAAVGGSVSGAADAAAAPGGSGGGGGGGGVGGLTLPAHLCTHRPPTPVCKEDDLLSSLRHMTSPSRRRSRFASAADSSLFVAAASAVAADDAGLLDSPPGSFTTAAGGGLLAGDARLRRSAVAGLSDSGSLVTAMSGGGGGLGPQGGEPPASPSLLLRSLGAAAAAGLEAGPGPRLPSVSASMSMSMTWRSAAQLMPVPEEPALPQSRGDPVTSASGGLGDGAAATSGASPSFSRPSAGTTAATGGGCGGPSSRRLRTVISAVSGSEAGLVAAETGTGHATGHPTGPRSSLRGGPAANSGPLDDSLSSFMHSFGPATPGGDRRCPTAASAPDGAQPVPVAGSGRVSAR